MLGVVCIMGTSASDSDHRQTLEAENSRLSRTSADQIDLTAYGGHTMIVRCSSRTSNPKFIFFATLLCASLSAFLLTSRSSTNAASNPLDLKGLAEQVLRDGHAKGDDLRVKIADDLLRIIASIKASTDDTADRIEEKIDARQKAILENYRVLLERVQSTADTNRDELQKSLEALQQDISNKLPFGRSPLVTRMTPYIVIPGALGNVFIRIRGVNLGKDFQKLEIGGKKYSSVGSGAGIEVNPVEATFLVPRDAFETAGMTAIPASLSIDVPASGVVATIRSRREPKKISVPISVAPKFAGTMKVVVKTKQAVRANDKIIENDGYHRGKETGCTPYTYVPEPGWLIDVSSWKIKGTRGEYGYLLPIKPGDVTPRRFSLQVCVKVKHNKGSQTAMLRWTEYQMKDVFKDVTVFDGPIEWAGRRGYELPANTVAVSSTFTNFLGESEEATGDYSFSYAVIEQYLGERKVFIKSKPSALLQ